MPQRDFEELLFDVGGNLVSTGAANAYAVQTAQSVEGYYNGLWLRIKANHSNSGASTLAINGKPTAPIVRNANTALAGGEIVEDLFFEVVYDEAISKFKLQNVISGITNAQLATMAQATIKGRQVAGGTGAPEDLTGTQAVAILPDASTTQRGPVEHATDAEIRSAASGNFVVTAASLESAAAIVGLTDAATIAVDWDAGINYIVTLTANRILGNPTNEQVGTNRTVRVLGNDATDRTLTFGNQYTGALPTLTDIDNGKQYLLTIFCYGTDQFMIKSTVLFP